MPPFERRRRAHAVGDGAPLRPLVLATACLSLALAAAGTADEPPRAQQVLDGTILEDQVAELLAGQMVLEQAQESDHREMAVALACLVPPDRRGSLAGFRHDRAIMPESYLDTEGPIEVDDLEGSLAKLEIGDLTEARRYLAAAPGWELSLSSEEIATFNALEPAPGGEVAAVEKALRGMFAERVRAYRERGLDGIAPFDRGGGETSSVAEDLRDSMRVAEGFQQVLPEVFAALQAFPGSGPEDSEQFYFWTRIRILGRPVFLLNQRLAGSFGDTEVVIERQFYATQFLGAGQTLIAVVPVQEGTLAVYVNRSFVDRWTGPSFAQGAKRAVGLKLINDVLREMAERQDLCGGVPASSSP